MPASFATMAMDFYLPLAEKIAVWSVAHDGPLVVGVNGAQGTGKSTLSKVLALALGQGHQRRCAVLSIDDIYLTKAERRQLADGIHPLLATRGVPGTHDVSMGCNLINRFKNQQPVTLPVFDKSVDDRAPEGQWVSHLEPVDIVLFEGWCVGATAQVENDLVQPVNHLEKNEDAGACWRKYANDQLNGPYAELFAHIDRLVMLKAPGFDCVHQWRSTQEEKLRLKSDSAHTNNALMDEQQIERFIMHYERITRWMLAEMPGRADCVLELNPGHQVTKSTYTTT